MSYARGAVSWLVAPMLGAYIGVLSIAAGYALLLQYGPELEAALSPVVRFDPTTDITRTGSVACFTLHMTKLHVARPIRYVFHSQTKTSEYVDVSPYIADTSRKASHDDYVDHPVGATWSRHYCFDVSTTVADNQDIRIYGVAVHRRHPVWDSTTEIPPFVVPALVKLSTKPVLAPLPAPG